MDEPNLLLRIRNMYPSYSPAFNKIADFLLTNKPGAEYLQIAEVAEKSGVGKATVTRFVRSLGYSSYKKFQMDIARDAAKVPERAPDIFGYGHISIEDSVEDVCKIVFRSNVQALRDTLALLDFETLELVADKIMESRQIVIFASGRSKIPAESIRMRLTRMGIICQVFSDSHEQLPRSVLMTPKDLVIGISAFGRSATVIRCMERAGKKGAVVVGITSCRKTPIVKAAHYMLYTVSSEPLIQGSEPFCTTVTHTTILDCLYMLVVMRTMETSKRNIKDGSAAIEQELKC